MNARASGLKASAGLYSSAGPRENNEDFAAAVFGEELPDPRGDVIAAIADGVGSAKGGRVAAEMAVRGFIDGFCDLPETLEVQRAGARIVTSLNSWIHAQGRHDPKLANMGATLTALILRGRMAHVLHVGDTRAYRFSQGRLACLTTDHIGKVGGVTGLARALGAEAEVRLDYQMQPIALHDRLLLLSDGVHGTLDDDVIADVMNERSAPDDTARALVARAMKYGSGDNCTALVLDVTALPQRDRLPGAELPMIATPSDGESVDGFLLQSLISDGRFTRLLAATDENDGGAVALKFPKPQTESEANVRGSFAREAYVGETAESPWLAQVIELPPGRQTCLYTAMPLYQGELLEDRMARAPAIGMEEGRNIAIRLARAATALHRAGIVHRDIKPDNVMLEGQGALKLMDFGVARIKGRDDLSEEGTPGTRAYMAPEMLQGEKGSEATDIYALGVTMFRAFTGAYPYGNADAMSPPRRERATDLLRLRPDLPAWLSAALARAIAPDPDERFQDMMEFASAMESGPASAAVTVKKPRTLYERAPLQFWQGVAGLLAFALLVSLMWR